MTSSLCRYNENLELEDAIHTAILTLKVSSQQQFFEHHFPKKWKLLRIMFF